jgi:hypothetical protein
MDIKVSEEKFLAEKYFHSLKVSPPNHLLITKRKISTLLWGNLPDTSSQLVKVNIIPCYDSLRKTHHCTILLPQKKNPKVIVR